MIAKRARRNHQSKQDLAQAPVAARPRRLVIGRQLTALRSALPRGHGEGRRRRRVRPQGLLRRRREHILLRGRPTAARQDALGLEAVVPGGERKVRSRQPRRAPAAGPLRAGELLRRAGAGIGRRRAFRLGGQRVAARRRPAIAGRGVQSSPVHGPASRILRPARARRVGSRRGRRRPCRPPTDGPAQSRSRPQPRGVGAIGRQGHPDGQGRPRNESERIDQPQRAAQAASRAADGAAGVPRGTREGTDGGCGAAER